jgi:hypothetical protein
MACGSYYARRFRAPQQAAHVRETAKRLTQPINLRQLILGILAILDNNDLCKSDSGLVSS